MKYAIPAALCCLAIAACVGTTSEETPESPDLSGLRAQYQTPTADFAAATITEVLGQLNDSLSLNDDMDGLEFVRERVIAPAVTEAENDEGDRIIRSLDGFVRVRHICHGYVADAPPDEALNGSISMVITFSERGLNRLVFGAARACRVLVGGEELFLDGSLRYDILDFLFSADLRVELSGALSADGPFSFRAPEEVLELLLTFADGTYLTFWTDAARSSAGFRAANGEWLCDLTMFECTGPGGEKVSIAGIEL